MDFFAAYLSYGKPGQYQWADFISEYENTSYAYFEKEIEKFNFLRINLNELALLVAENLRFDLDELTYLNEKFSNKSALFHHIIYLTDLAFKRELLSSLPNKLKIDFHFRYEDGLIRDSVLEILISELENSSPNVISSSWFENDSADWQEDYDYDFQITHAEFPDAEQLIDYFNFFSFGDTALSIWLDNWNYSFLIKANPKIELIKPIRITNTFDPTVYALIKKQPELLRTMDWRLFEEMLADILKRFKYEVELTRPTKDGGIDIIAIKRDFEFGEHKYILQAKRYLSAVEVSPVRELLFLHNHHKASKSCLATTATFTKGAWELADQYKWQLELKDQQGIMSWINKIVK